MKIAEFSVKNYQFTIIIFIMVMAIGISSFFNIPKAEDPSFKPPFFVVIAVYPGTSPLDMEELVADPIEEVIYELDDIKEVRNNIDDGLSVTQIEFKYGSNRDDKYDEVVREINNLRSKLPADILSLEIRKFTPSDVKIVQVALMSETAPYRELEAQGEILKDELEKLKSLKNIDVEAFPKQQIRVSLNLVKMAQNKIPLNRVLGAIQSEDANIPAGSIEIADKKFNVKTSGNYESIEEIRNTIVSQAGNAVVRLKDVADVSQNYEEESYFARYNGKRAVFVTASMKEGGNLLLVKNDLNEILDKYQSNLPPNIQYEKVFDQSIGVAKRLNNFTRDFIIAIALVLLTLVPLGLRASFVVMISIPLSLAMGLAMLNFLGYTINQLSIVGFVIALGLLVDDSIVVVENIERFLRMGYKRKEASIAATKQIGLAVVGCTAVLIFAFLPLLFLPEASGEFIRSLPMAVITTVLASLFVSVTIVPFLASLILKNEENPEGNIFLRGLKWLISGSYRRLLNVAVVNPIWTLLIAFGIFVGCLMLVPLVGLSVFPKSDKPQFLITAETPLGTSLYETDKIARDVEKILKKNKEIKSYTTNIGKGNPRVYYNVTQKNESSSLAEFFVQTIDLETPELGKLIDELRDEFRNFTKARVEVIQFEQGPPLEAPIAVRVIGENLDTLRSLAFQMEALVKSIPGTIYTNNPLTTLNTDLKIEINKEKAGLLGIPTVEIDRTVRMGIAGLNVATYKDEKGDELDINVTLPKAQRQTMNAFDKMYIGANNGNLIPLRQLADVRLQASPTIIRHFNKERYVTITASVASGFLTTNITNEVLAKLEKFKFPKGYTYNLGGEAENSREAFGGLEAIIIITIFGILAILILEFKTFKSTLIVLSVIPLGIIGAVLILLASGNSFSFTAVIGLIALIGIEIKNSILLVDYTNQLREGGMGLDEAIEVAGETRFIPIILTTLTAIGGLIPLAWENSPLYSPLALVIIGGLISSTLLTRFVTPVLYKLLPPKIALKKEVA